MTTRNRPEEMTPAREPQASPSSVVQTEAENLRRPPKPRVIFEVSPSLFEQIRERAIAQGLTLTAYMMKLLAADGLDTTARNPHVDGRTLRRQRERKSA